VEPPRPAGRVFLVGAGPGDPGLLTLKGARCLQEAEVVLYDELVDRRLLDLVPPSCERLYVGKRGGHKSLPQEELNALLVAQGQQGRRVVRLKGGDPFVFGRGSEEVQACVAAGVTVEVVPGISSAIAAPSAAGIPVTHRGLSTGFAVITGHQISELQTLAQLQITLVVLMGVATLPELVSGLLAAGKSPSTPVAIIERASTPQQRATVGTLESILALATQAEVSNPAVIVIGDVVSVPTMLAAESAFSRAAR